MPRPTTTRTWSKKAKTRCYSPLLDSGAIEVVHEDWVDDWKPEYAKRIVNAAIAKGLVFDAILGPQTMGQLADRFRRCVKMVWWDGKVLVTGKMLSCPPVSAWLAGSQTMTVRQATASAGGTRGRDRGGDGPCANSRRRAARSRSTQRRFRRSSSKSSPSIRATWPRR